MTKRSDIPTTPLYLRTPLDLDKVLEEMTRIERRTKTAIMSFALELYAERNHPGLLAKYRKGLA
jgi:hypothetical protein